MYIDIPARTLDAWGNRLTETEMAALQERGSWELDDELEPGEVLEALVEWHGGLFTAYQVKSMVSRIYGVEL